jgi:hypothetical protein
VGIFSGLFTIQENPPDGTPGERFEWSASMNPPSASKGGGRCCPIKPWSLIGTLRQVRTEYPGARRPSAQVLGYSLGPSTLSGVFDDRYNFGGFAIGEMRRFEEMIARGNPVTCQYLSIVREGLITNIKFDYRKEWDIGYEFTLDVHSNPSKPLEPDRSPDSVDTPASHFDKLDAAIQAMLDVHNDAPATLMTGSTVPDMADSLTAALDDRDGLGATLDNRELNPPENPVDAFTRMATQFRQVRATVFNALLTIAAVRSDAALAVQTATSVLDFEEWSRGLRFMGRIAMGRGLDGDRACTRRASPDAKRLYRPQAGESLYHISRLFYGTPHAWRLIYERNALRTWTLTGSEILVIPERGGT